jgi:hypothetical protein
MRSHIFSQKEFYRSKKKIRDQFSNNIIPYSSCLLFFFKFSLLFHDVSFIKRESLNLWTGIREKLMFKEITYQHLSGETTPTRNKRTDLLSEQEKVADMIFLTLLIKKSTESILWGLTVSSFLFSLSVIFLITRLRCEIGLPIKSKLLTNNTQFFHFSPLLYQMGYQFARTIIQYSLRLLRRRTK